MIRLRCHVDDVASLKPQSPRSHFLDSGSFTLNKASRKFAKETGRSQWDYYDTPEFWAYCREYRDFVHEYQIAIDHYANVDVIGNPELSWRNQQHLESLGMKPVPVVHYGSDLKWVKRYAESGHDYIALGGLVGVSVVDARPWLTRVFSAHPDLKFHGFGVTGFRVITGFPWHSVDSSTWIKISIYGSVLVPPYRGREFRLGKSPRVVPVSFQTPGRKGHYLSMPEGEQRIVRLWLREIGLRLGTEDDPNKGSCLPGVANNTELRAIANQLYFANLEQWLTENPPKPVKGVRGFFP